MPGLDLHFEKQTFAERSPKLSIASLTPQGLQSITPLRVMGASAQRCQGHHVCCGLYEHTDLCR